MLRPQLVKLHRSTPPPPSVTVLHILSLACATYGGYVFLYGCSLRADLAGKIRLAGINATLWTVSMAAKDVSVYQPANTYLWLPIIPGHYVSLDQLAVSEAQSSALEFLICARSTAVDVAARRGCCEPAAGQHQSPATHSVPSALQVLLVAAYCVVGVVAGFLVRLSGMRMHWGPAAGLGQWVAGL